MQSPKGCGVMIKNVRSTIYFVGLRSELGRLLFVKVWTAEGFTRNNLNYIVAI